MYSRLLLREPPKYLELEVSVATIHQISDALEGGHT